MKKDSLGLYIFNGVSEHSIRPPAQTVMALGIALSINIYDEKIVGISNIEAKEIQTNLIKSLLKEHKANGGKWGNCWQCAHWAFYSGFGAWLSLDLLDTETEEQLLKMIVMEANNFNKEPPYCNDCTNDTKAEENAWNANILTLALATMPKHENAKWWKERASQWMLSAYSRESDLSNNPIIDGKPINHWISGWNMHEDGYVYNHNRIHPYYTAAANINLWNPLVFTLANQKGLQAAYWNMSYVYKQLIDFKWQNPPYQAPGGTIYRRDSNTLHATVYYPNGTDWSVNLVDNFFMFDVQCSVMGLDNLVDISAVKWANTRADYMLWMQSRSTTGQLYTKEDNLNFPPKESKAASMFALARLTIMLKQDIGKKL
ncbi:hypothetical protein [Mariniflexile sp. AS56]|uniref:hypothetical protein n=1 Tax=Mariniflexile sp. AS56 TaxID=3063957 RepID=UPI0026ECD455|nr:hypothetical protein [Mariniflexile sp. AS56]MDO7172531.1 hypothetical protein [Mariniflexile sp. AS56]